MKLIEKVVLAIIIALCVLIIVLVAIQSNASATSLDKATEFRYNGIQFLTGSFIHKNEIYVPVKTFSAKLGHTTKYNKDKTITISNKKYSVLFKIGSKKVYINGNDMKIMNTELLVIDGMAFIPVRYIRYLGKYVEIYNDVKIRVISITDYSVKQEIDR